MKVLQVHTRYRQAGGEDRVVAAEAALLRSAGHDVVELITDNPTGPVAAAVALARAPWNTTAADIAREAGRRHNPDVAHVHNTWYASSPSVLAALKQTGIPTVVTIHNYRLMCVNGMLLRDGRPCEDCIGRVPWRGVLHRCYHDSAAASSSATATAVFGWRRGVSIGFPSLYLAPTDFVRERLLRSGVPGKCVIVKPHFVEDPGRRSAPPSRSRSVLYVGRLSVDKGADDLLEAWETLGDVGLELTYLGDGPLRSSLSKRAIRGTRFLGSVGQREVQRWMLRSRVLIAPSKWYETFGLGVAEAMAAGLPVIVPRKGALAEVAGDAGIATTGGTGSVVEQIIRALQRSCDDAVVDAAGQAGRARFLAEFTESTGLARLLEAYQLAIESNGAGAHADIGGEG
jgi:glycosyltransferase involved in cell wall biosynthesis